MQIVPIVLTMTWKLILTKKYVKTVALNSEEF